MGLLLDLSKHHVQFGVAPIEHTIIPVLPDKPSVKVDQRVKPMPENSSASALIELVATDI